MSGRESRRCSGRSSGLELTEQLVRRLKQLFGTSFPSLNSRLWSLKRVPIDVAPNSIRSTKKSDMVATPTPMPSEAEAALLKLVAYCRKNNWAGFDPFDALNSRAIERLPLLDNKLPRLVLTQVLKRSPINLRPLMLVPKVQNP